MGTAPLNLHFDNLERSTDQQQHVLSARTAGFHSVYPTTAISNGNHRLTHMKKSSSRSAIQVESSKGSHLRNGSLPRSKPRVQNRKQGVSSKQPT